MYLMVSSSKDVEFTIEYMKYEHELFISIADSDIGGSMHCRRKRHVVTGAILVITDTDHDTDIGPETGSSSSLVSSSSTSTLSLIHI